ILNIINGLTMNMASQQINDTIANGKFTIMFDMDKLGAKDTYNPIVTRLYGGADLMHPPPSDGTDMWPVIPDLLEDPTDIKSAKVIFNQSYLTKNTWVSGSKGDVTLALSLQGTAVAITIHNALIAMDLDSAHKSATNGTVAGIISTDELITTIKEVAAN